MIIALFGLPGTGKTTVRKELGKYLDFFYFSTDELRKEVLKDPEKQLEYADEAPLSWEEILMGYRIICYAARPLLKLKQNILFDAAFSSEKMRKYVRDLAEETKTPLNFIEVTCPEHIVKERLQKRLDEKASESNAGWKVYLKVKRNFTPLEEKHFTIDTSKKLEEQLKIVLAKIKI